MRQNPLLMTVMSNPCQSNPGYQANPFILIDSATNKIIRTWRGSMMDRKPWDWAADAARRLGRPVFVVAHPYVPQTFRAGVEVSPLFYAGGSFQEVRPDGSTGPGPAYGYKKNPGFFPSMVGGIAGSLVANALSNPRGPSEPDEHAARELELYITNDADLYRQQFVPIVKNLMKKRAKGVYNSEKATKLFLYLADAGAKKYYKEFGSGDWRFDLATRWAVAKSLRDSFETEAGLGNYDKMTWGVSNNPPAGSAWEKMTRRQREKTLMFAGVDEDSAYHLSGSSWGTLDPGARHKVTAGWRDSSKTPRRRRASYSVSAQANPGPIGRRRKVTMTLEAFARYIKSKNDPRLWKDFIKKIKGYQKWTHGALPKSVTIEVVDKPGVSGLWMTYDAGTVPESAYVMPKGSKRKGAWKHPWETGHPRIKHDPESGIVMHKLTGQNRISDFYHK